MVQGNIKAYWWPAKNFGDMLSPIIIKHFTGKEITLAGRQEQGRLLAVGSILHLIRDNDVVWGTGLNRRLMIALPSGVKFLAVRGPITRHYTRDRAPEIYGDPGILMPMIYNPKIEKKHKVGVMPHYVDKPFVKLKPGEIPIDVQQDWKKTIDQMLSCEKIIASSLHGIVCAEAYGIPAVWTRYSNKIRGKRIKYQDYFLGTGRGIQKYNAPIPPIQDLEKRQKILIDALQNYYGKN